MTYNSLGGGKDYWLALVRETSTNTHCSSVAVAGRGRTTHSLIPWVVHVEPMVVRLPWLNRTSPHLHCTSGFVSGAELSKRLTMKLAAFGLRHCSRGSSNTALFSRSLSPHYSTIGRAKIGSIFYPTLMILHTLLPLIQFVTTSRKQCANVSNANHSVRSIGSCKPALLSILILTSLLISQDMQLQ